MGNRVIDTLLEKVKKGQLSRREFLQVTSGTLGTSTATALLNWIGVAESAAELHEVRELMLLECHIAGTAYADVDDIEPTLLPDDLLLLRREPDNRYDALAILILNEAGQKLGYVPRAKNEVLARLMDAGKPMFGRLRHKEWVNNWLKVDIQVYMQDV